MAARQHISGPPAQVFFTPTSTPPFSSPLLASISCPSQHSFSWRWPPLLFLQPSYFILIFSLDMSEEYCFAGAGAGAGFEDSGFFDGAGVDDVLKDAFRQFVVGGDGYAAFEEVEQCAGAEWEDSGFFEDVYQEEVGEGVLGMAAPGSSPPPSPSAPPASSINSAVSLAHSLDDKGITLLNDRLCATPQPLTTSTYTPHPHILAHQPESPPDPNALYAPLTTSSFPTSAAAKAHRRRPRLAPKTLARDITRVKSHGRNYWVCRLYNAMIDTTCIADGAHSIHRTRFTQKRAFEALDLEAAAHAVFDEAIAVHERGWNRPKVYHKQAVRGRLVDVSEGSCEMRLSRVCEVLRRTKSAVDDAVRGGVTLALLCDNPEARGWTKVSNEVGNRKRGERLREAAGRGKKRAKGGEDVVEVEEQVEVDGEVAEVAKVEDEAEDEDSQES